MKFSGNFNGHSSFAKVEGTCPNDVVVRIDPGLKQCDLRCWVQIQGQKGGRSRWSEVFLDVPNFFQSIQDFIEDKENVQIRFRSPLLERVPNPDLLDIQENMTDLTLEESFSSESSGEHSRYECLQVGGTPTNPNDPFSGKDVATLIDSFSITFYSKNMQSTSSRTLCVSKSSLEAFVAQALNEGKDIFRLNIARDMECRDKRKRSFSLTPTVWVESLLPHSRVLRTLFYKANEVSFQRRYQLLILHNDLNLWRRAHYWVSDLFSTRESAKKRLGYQSRQRFADGTLSLLSSSIYFTSEEGENLGRIVMPNGTFLRDLAGSSFLDVLDEEDLQLHQLGLEICKGLDINDSFRHDPAFILRKQQWIRDRKHTRTRNEV
jgi:hypothetical protein